MASAPPSRPGLPDHVDRLDKLDTIAQMIGRYTDDEIIAEIKSIFRENQPKNIVMLDEIVILSMFEITLTKLMLSIKLSCYKIKTAILSARCSDVYDFC